MRERILAVLGAIALVAVAFVVRSSLAGDDEPSGRRGSGARPVVACTPDLMAICRALAAEGSIATDPPSLDLAGAAMTDDAIDGWITWDPAPGIADVDADGTWTTSRPLGSAPLAVATRSGNALVLAGCPDSGPTWACLATADPALARGVGSGLTAESLARLHPLAATLVPTDGDFTAISSSELGDIIDSPAVGQARFPEQLRTLKTQLGALAILVGPKGAFDDSDLLVSEPTPAADATIVLAQRRKGEDLLARAFDAEPVDRAVRDAGVTPGAGTLAPKARAEDLYALRERVG